MISKSKIDYTRYKRRKTISVDIGGIPLGSNHPIRIQSMTNTPTIDIEATAEQIVRIQNEGAHYARVAVPTRKEAEGLQQLVYTLGKRNCRIPLIADIHFNPRLAFISAEIVNKVRINPGNFVDRKKTGIGNYSKDEYILELSKLKEQFTELINICKSNDTALRIGTNHGSLSDRIMSRYGDTPEGMAESAMEFLRICKEEDFNEVVVSMKASNTRIMVYATRLLVKKMDEEGMLFPLHLGVTEAGEGEDGRIKSAVGIGALLADGIGDTIRVSLTENPEIEVPVAKKLTDYITEWENHRDIPEFGQVPINTTDYKRRENSEVFCIGGNHQPVVVSQIHGSITYAKMQEIGWHKTKDQNWTYDDLSPDTIIVDSWASDIPLPEGKQIVQINPISDTAPIFIKSWSEYLLQDFSKNEYTILQMMASELDSSVIEKMKTQSNLILVLETNNINGFADQRSAIFRLMNADCNLPIILKRNYQEEEKEDFQLKASVDLGGLFIDGLGDGIWLENEGSFSEKEILETSFGILQASRVRFSKTEFISCPSCGRTLFDLQTTIQRIRERTSHLKGLKIGIMGCIVNGPGEMADADYGYVGTGKGLVTLYKAREVVQKNISETNAVDALINLIKKYGDWVDP